MIKMLVLEPDELFRKKLLKALAEANNYELTVADNWQSAMLLLAHHSHDLALIAVEETVEGSIEALRMVQPDLRVAILTSPKTNHLSPVMVTGQIQGMLIRSMLDDELDRLIDKVLLQTVTPAEERGARLVAPQSILPLLEKVELGENVHTAIFSHTTGLIASVGGLTQRQAAAVSVLVRRAPNPRSYPVQMQFMHVPGQPGDWLVYSRLVGDGYLLTLVAWAHAAVGLLRVQADELVPLLAQAVGVSLPAVEEQFLPANGAPATGSESKTFAIVWRPIERLPAVLHIPLRRTLERLAQANGCMLRHLAVSGHMVHMVITCPPGRNTIWVAHQFKSGSEEEIRQQFGVRATLWAKGYYATESSVALSDAELNLFLERSQVEA